MADEARLKEMLDTYEIRDLAQRYAVAVSFKDVDAIAELFDPEVDNGIFGTGRTGVRNFYENFFRIQTRRTLEGAMVCGFEHRRETRSLPVAHSVRHVGAEESPWKTESAH